MADFGVGRARLRAGHLEAQKLQPKKTKKQNKTKNNNNKLKRVSKSTHP
jgi:hypothetical protein